MLFAHCSAHLKPINEALREFDQLYEQLHGLITIKVGDLNWVYKYVCILPCLSITKPITTLTSSAYDTCTRWRDEQEQHMRAANKPALSPEQVRDFVDRFMPAYEAYLPRLYATSGTTGTGGASTPADSAPSSPNLLAELPQLALEIDEARLPLP